MSPVERIIKPRLAKQQTARAQAVLFTKIVRVVTLNLLVDATACRNVVQVADVSPKSHVRRDSPENSKRFKAWDYTCKV